MTTDSVTVETQPPQQKNQSILATSGLFLKCVSGRSLLCFALILILALAYTLGMSHFLPFDQDEVLQHHGLACWYYPLNWVNDRFPAGCELWLLRLPGTNIVLPLRSYEHVGVFQSLLYYPLFLIWKHPYSARFFGILMIGAQAYLLGRLYRKSPLVIFTGILCLLPYAYHHLIDIGHLTVHTMAVCAFQLATLQLTLSNSRRRDLLLCAFLGLLVAIAIQVRISFMFLVPALMLQLGVAFILKYRSLKSYKGSHRAAILSLVTMLSLLLITSLLPTLIIFSMIDVNSAPYYMVMVRNSSGSHLRNFLGIYQKFISMSGFIIEPLNAAHILLGRLATASWALSSYQYGAIGFFCVSLIAPSSWRTRGLVFVNLACAVLSLVAVSASSRSYGAHNVVPCLVFVISAAVAAFSGEISKRRLFWRGLQWTFLIGFLASNLYCYKTLLEYSSHPGRSYHRNLLKLFDHVNEHFASSHLTVTLDWNAYYTKSLYGPKDQSVLCLDGLPLDHYPLAAKIAKNLGRKIIFITNSPPDDRMAALQRVFAEVKRVPIPFDVGGWQLLEAQLPMESPAGASQ